MARSIKKNFFYNLIYQMSIIIVPIITIPYVSRVLTPGYLGIESIVKANTQYFILFGTLGIGIYGSRKIAEVRDNNVELKKTFWEIFAIQFTGCIIAGIVFLFFASNSQYSRYYYIQGLLIISYAIDISWYFRGIEDFKKASLRAVLVKGSGVFLILLFIKDPSDIWKYIFINTGMNLFGQVVMWFYIDKAILSINDIRNMTISKHLNQIIIFFVPEVAIQIYTVMDKTMISFFGNTAEIAYYDQSQKIISIALSAVTSLGLVMLPRIANLLSRNKVDEAKVYLYKAFQFNAFLSIPISLGILGVSNNFVPVFFGAEYIKVIPLMMIGSIIIISTGITDVFGTQYLLANGKIKEYNISVIIGAISNLILNFIFIPKFLSIGAIIASVISYILIGIFQTYFSRHLITKKYIQVILKYLICGVFMELYILLVNIIYICSFQKLIIQIFGGIIIYFFILVILRDEIILSNAKKVINVFNNMIRRNLK
ncbi:O-antigen/teichoic acid export membrane protein [Clostridium beijerinckii]|uniref:oligosaccharide flippase family protein n=1 Tax=Clostridium beijerinckii TaxID=1520 RepID=UPI001494D6BD|nr:polysaccharide biosynthesis C-terminal domain-containing protein [Clostridium beijerinckii]NOW85435.1 O-antigen/teichoic acid export membrane protein [Clostridium beijerinckii]